MKPYYITSSLAVSKHDDFILFPVTIVIDKAYWGIMLSLFFWSLMYKRTRIPKDKNLFTGVVHNPLIVNIHGIYCKIDETIEEGKHVFLRNRVNPNSWINAVMYNSLQDGRYYVQNIHSGEWLIATRDEICEYTPDTKVKGYMIGDKFVIVGKK